MTRVFYLLMGVAFAMALWLREPLLALLALMLALLAGLTWLWDRYALTEVSYVRRLGVSRMFVGEEMNLAIEVVNAKPLPLAWLKAVDEFPGEMTLKRGYLGHSFKRNRRLLTNLLALRFYERVRKQYQVRAIKRGVLEFGPVTLHAGDLFGFRQQERVVGQIDELVVYPRIVPMPALGLPAAHPFGDAVTRRRISDDPLRVTGARPYVPGDNPRFIHWKATARRGELQTRTFDAGASPRTAIFLDVQTVRGMPGIVDSYLEYAITAAASVAHDLLERREAVGLYVNTWRRRTSELVRLPASRRPDQWRAMLEALARVLDVATVGFDRFLQAELPALPFGAGVIAISSLPDAKIYAALLDVQRAGHPTWLLVVADDEPVDIPDALRWTWIGGRQAYRQLNDLDKLDELDELDEEP
jgi:uncharacterized protein (DUF58 family)